MIPCMISPNKWYVLMFVSEIAHPKLKYLFLESFPGKTAPKLTGYQSEKLIQY